MDNGVNLGGATPYLLAAQAADVEAMRLLQTLAQGCVDAFVGEYGCDRFAPGQQPNLPTLSAREELKAKSANRQLRIAYAAAYNLVKQLIRSEGENKVWQRVADRSYSIKA